MNTRAIFSATVLAALIVVPTRHLDAQACSGPTQALDACRKAIDLSNFVAPPPSPAAIPPLVRPVRSADLASLPSVCARRM
jgi:hypothetical protein